MITRESACEVLGWRSNEMPSKVIWEIPYHLIPITSHRFSLVRIRHSGDIQRWSIPVSLACLFRLCKPQDGVLSPCGNRHSKGGRHGGCRSSLVRCSQLFGECPNRGLVQACFCCPCVDVEEVEGCSDAGNLHPSRGTNSPRVRSNYQYSICRTVPPNCTESGSLSRLVVCGWAVHSHSLSPPPQSK